MPIPKAANILVSQAVEMVTHHPEHRLAPPLRRAIYDAFGSRDVITVNQARSWLAIITAERVLPIFERALPFEKMPRRLLNLARRVVNGGLAVNSRRVELYEEYSYHASGNSWGYDELDLPVNAKYAGYAPRKTLLEVCGYEYFLDLSTHDQLSSFERRLVEASWIEESIGSIESGDTAATAAAAYAASANSRKCDPEKLQEFWNWWLREAIPQSWELAAKN